MNTNNTDGTKDSIEIITKNNETENLVEDETKLNNKSSRSYSNRTLKILWGRAAGRCALPTCRLELFVDATDHDPIVIIGDIAHITASSNSGPRANRNKTKKERDEYDNLILLCKNCHDTLDGQKNSNSEEKIYKLKDDHEAWVRNSLPERGKSTMGWAVMLLQGVHPFDLERVITALIPDFPEGDPITIKVEPDKQDWREIQQMIIWQVDKLFSSKDPFDFRLAVFPLAPVTACIALGYYLTNRPNVRLFQYDRDEHIWNWPDQKAPLTEIRIDGMPADVVNGVGDVAILFHLSASITDDDIAELKMSFLGKINIRVSSPNTGWLRHADQLKKIATYARMVFEDCLAHYPKSTKWHIFFAGPAPAGVIIGQQANPTMCPPIQLYEFKKNRTPAYEPSIIIGGKNND